VECVFLYPKQAFEENKQVPRPPHTDTVRYNVLNFVDAFSEQFESPCWTSNLEKSNGLVHFLVKNAALCVKIIVKSHANLN